MRNEEFPTVLHLLLNKNMITKSQERKVCEEEDSRLAFD